jgi:molybdopterin converting factor small subunit
MQAPARTITVNVLLFAAYRETLGQRQIDLDVPAGSTPDDVFRLLAERQPGMSRLRDFTTFAVNREVVSAETRLSDGDELALLQPVSGGNGA